MELTESTKVITRKALTDKVCDALTNDDNECDNDAVDALDDLQGDVENLLALHWSKAQKWVDIGLNEYIPLSDFKEHYHKDNVGGTELDDSVTTVDL